MSGGSQNTVSQQTVPSWLQPYLTSTLSSAQGLEQTGGPQYYPGQTVAGLTPLQSKGSLRWVNWARNRTPPMSRKSRT